MLVEGSLMIPGNTLGGPLRGVDRPEGVTLNSDIMIEIGSLLVTYNCRQAEKESVNSDHTEPSRVLSSVLELTIDFAHIHETEAADRHPRLDSCRIRELADELINLSDLFLPFP